MSTEPPAVLPIGSTARRLLDRIESYYDLVPRASARTEAIGPFTLFVRSGPGWPYYARPTLGAGGFTVHDVRTVRARQCELGLPEAIEWVHDVTPGLAEAVVDGGLTVTRYPLMVALPESRRACAAGISEAVPTALDLRSVGSADYVRVRAVAETAFAHPGTAIGPADVPVPAPATETLPPPAGDARSVDTPRVGALPGNSPESAPPAEDPLLRLLRDGRMLMTSAWTDTGPVGVASAAPRGDCAEIMGVGTLPAARRQGIATAMTTHIMDRCRRAGVELFLLSAADEDVARMYGRLGFDRIGTACIAEAP